MKKAYYMEKAYYCDAGEHRFSDVGVYLGFFDADIDNLEISGGGDKESEPFKSWRVWDEDKHKLLTEILGFKEREL